jgi:hypothetical protein
VSGDEDSNAPLIIDPSTDPTDPLVVTSAGNFQTAMFVQRMPVTKVVTQITLGDLFLGPGCATGTLNAKIYEYVNREPGGADATFNSLGAQPVTITPSKVTWSFAPVTFHKDRGYAINVIASGGCSRFRQTTWAHNEPQVNPGQLRCASGPQGWKRMWHDAGVDDRIPGCVDRPAGQGTFHPSMPSGWLISQISQNGSGLWDVRKHSTPSAPVCHTPYPPNTYEAYGGAPIFWRPSPVFPGYLEYTCRWTQWADWGEQPEDGWYYAQPWFTERNGAPRDMYLKLETINYGALLDQHSPILVYHSAEAFQAISPGAATDFYDASDDPDDPDDANRLLDSSGAFASANHDLAAIEGIDELSLDYLAASYEGLSRPDQTPASDSDVISERGGGSAEEYSSDAMHMEGFPEYPNRIYGRVVHGESGSIWLQYWIFYYADPQMNIIGAGLHEGDWEMAQVRLNGALSPDRAAYAQHGGGESCVWPDVESLGGRPIVYVAKDSHASYFREGLYEDPDPDDEADGGASPVLPVPVQVKEETTDWIAWPGRWGDSDSNSPHGPMFQSSKWEDPDGWADDQTPCGEVN